MEAAVSRLRLAFERVSRALAHCAAVMIVCAAATSHAEAWLPSAEDRAALERREVVVHSEELPDQPASERGREVRAAIRIRASAEKVFSVMTDCSSALQFVPHMKKCILLARDPATGADTIEHVMDYGWYAPAVQYVFRVDYVPNRAVVFKAVSGDLERNEGRWELTPLKADPVTGVPETLLTYRVSVVPRFRVPQSWVRMSLKRELPRMLAALREFSERS